MKRRDFIKTAGAAAALPALPASAGAAVSPALYAQAAQSAARSVFTSAITLQAEFGLEQGGAKTLFEMLLRNRVIVGQNSLGIARPLTPYFANPALAGTARIGFKKTAQKIDDLVKDQLEQVIEDAEATDQEPSK